MKTWQELFLGLEYTGEATQPTDERERDDDVGTGKRRWLGRLKDNLARSRRAMAQQIAVAAFDADDPATWERIEEGLIFADVGVPSTVDIVSKLELEASGGRISDTQQLAQSLRQIAGELMGSDESASDPRRLIDLRHSPTVILMVGVNGTGKTTTIGKLAARLAQHGKKVVIGAADTFRAAAVEQLAVWAERANAELVRTKEGGDPAAVAYDAIERAREVGADVVLIDTAGRLHTKVNLMNELEKIRRVIEKQIPDAPHETLLTIDATTGQNGMRQAQEFSGVVKLTGVVLTKLDGSAKGGIAVAISNELGIPIKLVGIGESLDDLQPFDADEFLSALFPDDLLEAVNV